MGYQVKMPHGTMHYGLPPDVVLPPGALPVSYTHLTLPTMLMV